MKNYFLRLLSLFFVWSILPNIGRQTVTCDVQRLQQWSVEAYVLPAIALGDPNEDACLRTLELIERTHTSVQQALRARFGDADLLDLGELTRLRQQIDVEAKNMAGLDPSLAGNLKTARERLGFAEALILRLQALIKQHAKNLAAIRELEDVANQNPARRWKALRDRNKLIEEDQAIYFPQTRHILNELKEHRDWLYNHADSPLHLLKKVKEVQKDPEPVYSAQAALKELPQKIQETVSSVIPDSDLRRVDQLALRFDFLEGKLSGKIPNDKDDAKEIYEWREEHTDLAPLMESHDRFRNLLSEYRNNLTKRSHRGEHGEASVINEQQLIHGLENAAHELKINLGVYESLIERSNDAENPTDAQAHAIVPNERTGNPGQGPAPISPTEPLTGTIASFSDRELEDFFRRTRAGDPPTAGSASWSRYARSVKERLEKLDASKNLSEVQIKFGTLKKYISGKFKDYYGVKVDLQWRILFHWDEENQRAIDVFIVDYHGG